MRTQCVPCGKVLTSPSAAAKHVVQHKPVTRRGKSSWGSDVYVDGERWDAYAARTDPPNHAQKDEKTGVDSAEIAQRIAEHVGADYSSTACLCQCHFGCHCEGQKHGAAVPPCSEAKCG